MIALPLALPRPSHIPDFTRTSAHLTDVLNVQSLRGVVHRTVEALRPHSHRFDGIAFRGMSGSIVAPLVAMELGKSLILVRKGEQRYSGLDVEGDCNVRNYIILDDLVASGKTVRKIY